MMSTMRDTSLPACLMKLANLTRPSLGLPLLHPYSFSPLPSTASLLHDARPFLRVKYVPLLSGGYLYPRRPLSTTSGVSSRMEFDLAIEILQSKRIPQTPW